MPRPKVANFEFKICHNSKFAKNGALEQNRLRYTVTGSRDDRFMGTTHPRGSPAKNVVKSIHLCIQIQNLSLRQLRQFKICQIRDTQNGALNTRPGLPIPHKILVLQPNRFWDRRERSSAVTPAKSTLWSPGMASDNLSERSLVQSGHSRSGDLSDHSSYLIIHPI